MCSFSKQWHEDIVFVSNRMWFIWFRQYKGLILCCSSLRRRNLHVIFGALTSNLWPARKIGPKSSSSVSHWVLMDILAIHCGCCMCLADVCTAFVAPRWFSHLMAFALWHHLFCHHTRCRGLDLIAHSCFFTTTAATVTDGVGDYE